MSLCTEVAYLAFEGEPDLNHQPLVTGQAEHTVFTPNFDVHAKLFTRLNVELVGVRTFRWPPASGVPVAHVSGFTPPLTEAQRIAHVSVGRRLATTDRALRGPPAGVEPLGRRQDP